ncbi:MAG: hypothetical protein J7L14_01945 [Candidatus Diapherotrites archaeon]|nr:hypothetical protein [Candidatus Diapherotrites archaeon]
MQNIVVVDSSAIITMSSTCFINVFEKLKKDWNYRFVVPESVYYETVERPLEIPRFELNAVRVKHLFDNNVLEVAKKTTKLQKTSSEILRLANSCFSSHGKFLKVLQKADAEVLALAKELNAKMVAVDERTARMIIENPEALRNIIEGRTHSSVELDKEQAYMLKENFKDIFFIRSAELLSYAFSSRMFDEIEFSKKALEALLISAKLNGCGISFGEIDEFLSGWKNETKI